MTKNLKELSREDYESLKKTGFFWELFPQATGNYEEDCK
jgi:hypothetical protein